MIEGKWRVPRRIRPEQFHLAARLLELPEGCLQAFPKCIAEAEYLLSIERRSGARNQKRRPTLGGIHALLGVEFRIVHTARIANADPEGERLAIASARWNCECGTATRSGCIRGAEGDRLLRSG